MLKVQMEADKKAFEAISDENRRLSNVIEELNAKIRNLQGEVSANVTLTHCLAPPSLFIFKETCLG